MPNNIINFPVKPNPKSLLDDSGFVGFLNDLCNPDKGSRLVERQLDSLIQATRKGDSHD